ncbi:DUF3048 domain-containing protein [Fictibacillus aquaticus]|uniref:Lipoprotein YerB n=1 Tax=Fictibacillus aquaticus TaxID=2021314 RepID=A0A235F7W5_9BACL|nr:DUF3048 domain-containing protein [Fictibacillus aquaticus]OYD56785.1 lipoprotein YerB [Fictibacillus aquaticus]
MRKWLLLLVCLVISASLAGCKDAKEEMAKDGKVDQAKASEKVNKEKTYKYAFPLTGKKTNDEISRRPVAVMVNNHSKARPQSGLHKADIVYEVLAEGEITRFLAIFQSQVPEQIGPVRSARDYYIELSKGYDSLFVAHGWSPEAKEILESGAVDNLNGMKYDGKLFKRADFRKAPHNSYITYENIEKGADMLGYSMEGEVEPLPFLSKQEVKSLSGEKAESITIRYNSSESSAFEYDEVKKRYIRSANGEPSIDLETETPISVANVLIIETEHRTMDNKGRRDVDLTSGGKALLFQNGMMQEISWKNENGRIVPDGGKFVPGKTWINIVPMGMDKSVSIE